MSNMNHKWLRILLLIALPAFSVGQAAGQNILKYKYVGDNQIVLYDCEAGYNIVTLGNPKEAPGANDDEVQYYWELVRKDENTNAFFPDENTRKKPITTAQISSEAGLGDFVFCCSRVSKYGYQKEFVTITLKNTIDVIITPKNDCWSHGDQIKIDQFDIITTPKDLESHVDLDADSREAVNVAGPIHDTQELHFISDEPSRFPLNESNTNVTINVIRTSDFGGFHVDIPTKVGKMCKALKEGSDIKNKLEKVKKFTEPLKKFGPVDFSPVFNGDVDFVGGIECCQGGQAKFINFSGGFTAGVHFEIDAPLPPCPAIHFYAGLDASVSVNLFQIRWNYQKRCSECNCGGVSFIPFTLQGELYGGVSLAAVSKDLLSVSGEVAGGISWGGKIFFVSFAEDQATGDSNLFKMDDKASLYGKLRVKAVLLFLNYDIEATFAGN